MCTLPRDGGLASKTQLLLRLLASTSSTRRGGQHKLSMKLLASMVEAGLTPDAVTVGELISSLSDRGRWDDAQRVVEIAEKTGAIPASSLDSDFEVDVSHLPSAIAKVKVRNLGGSAGCFDVRTRRMCTGLSSVTLSSWLAVHLYLLWC